MKNPDRTKQMDLRPVHPETSVSKGKDIRGKVAMKNHDKTKQMDLRPVHPETSVSKGKDIKGKVAMKNPDKTKQMDLRPVHPEQQPVHQALHRDERQMFLWPAQLPRWCWWHHTAVCMHSPGWPWQLLVQDDAHMPSKKKRKRFKDERWFLQERLKKQNKTWVKTWSENIHTV